MATGDSPPRIPPRDRRETRRGGIPHVQGRQQNPDPAEGSREAGSSKSTAGHPAGMLRESGRQQQVTDTNPKSRHRHQPASTSTDSLLTCDLTSQGYLISPA